MIYICANKSVDDLDSADGMLKVHSKHTYQYSQKLTYSQTIFSCYKADPLEKYAHSI